MLELVFHRMVEFDRALAGAGALQGLRQAVVALRADHQVDGLRPRQDLAPFGLRNATGDSDQGVAALGAARLLDRTQPPDFRIDLFGRLFADVAGVEQHQVGVFGRCRLAIAFDRQCLGHARRIVDVHLTAIGLDVDLALRRAVRRGSGKPGDSRHAVVAVGVMQLIHGDRIAVLAALENRRRPLRAQRG